MVSGLMTRILFIGIACSLLLTARPAHTAEEAPETVESISAAIDGAQDPDRLAHYYKKLGDLYASRDDLKDAARSYLKALSGYSGFSPEERFSMAVTMSWAGMHGESVELLTSVLAENPGYTDARVQMARVLSWSGRLGAAIEEADRALKSDPALREARLVKANALRWKGESRAAIEVYETLLEEREGFEPRLGLGHALLGAGDTEAAREVAAKLTPVSSRERDDARKLTEAIKKAGDRRLSTDLNYYDDSDDNRVYRYTLKYDYHYGRWALGLDYSHAAARDAFRKNDFDSVYLRAYSKLTRTIGAGGGLGLSRPADSLTAHVKVDRDIGGSGPGRAGRAGLILSKGVMSDTAQLIENRIRTTALNLHLFRSLTDRVVGTGSLELRDYSDDNTAWDLNLSARYRYMSDPRIYVGYRLRYMDFDRHSGGGYFDPMEFLSHQLFAALRHEKKAFYVELDGYVGPQSFDRHGEHKSDIFSGGGIKTGRRITGDATVELRFDTGRSAQSVEGAAEYKYYLLGLNLIYVPGSGNGSIPPAE